MVDARLSNAGATAKAKLLFHLGPLALFLVAAAYGVLEVHPSADTWIGLAAGRQILTTGEITTIDSFSYTFDGQPWYNQNWLSHAFQYWLYSRISPAAVVYGTWAQSAAIFCLALVAAYWRCRSWIGALLAAACVAFGCRDYLYARPATVGFLCIAAMWAIICALEADPKRRRWIPIVLILPLLLIWGAAHGSFVFGYGVLGLYVGYSLVMRWIRPRDAIGGQQIIGIIAVVAAAFLLTCAFSPFGLEDFTHGEKVAGSSIFRKVSEWYSPFSHRNHFPPVWRFWTILATTSLVIALCGALRRFSPSGTQSEHRVRVALFDVAMVLLGLGMTLWARRFAPIFFVLAAPTVAALTTHLMQRVSAGSIARCRSVVAIGSFLLACWLGYETWTKAHADLVTDFESLPDFNLLERVVRYDESPHEAIEFIARNELPLRLLAEWSQAGMVFFNAPCARVYMDGRAQQVYDELHVKKYAALLLATDTPPPVMMDLLDESGTDAVLLRRWDRVRNLTQALERASEWVPALLTRESSLYLRKGSPGLERLGDLLRAGGEYRPDSPRSAASRGFVWAAVTPPNLNQALASLNTAIQENPTLGTICFGPMTRAMIQLGRVDDARRFIETWRRWANNPGFKIPEKTREILIETLDACGREIDSASDGR